MDNKSCQSSSDSTPSNTITPSTTTTTNTSHNYLRQLNKLSQKITKPIIKKPTFDPPPPPPQPPQNQTFQNPNNQTQPHNNNNNNNNNLQHQPPVYNINKNDFRDVVQKLTGSPAHDRTLSNPTPPPPLIHQPKPPSSRLQRIRPPPLAQISNRPQTPLLNQPHLQPNNAVNNNANFNFSAFGRPLAPLSPLPPFPTVHAAAESPVSAYMRYLHNSMPAAVDSKPFSGFSHSTPLVSPRWNNFPPPPPQQPPLPQQEQPQPSQQAAVPSSSSSSFQMPASPLPFGCLNSPISSSFHLNSPGLLFSPNSGQLGFPQLPLSPTVPVPSPRWRG
ncbi:hypothetical protein RIF29_11908 [Crotalaria pallida]|uniref:VQ domain-containing protein n=1 Tax=Crotalaria pallida TaxID=3830 RepID=A0AAN9P0F8_CROPI